MYTVTDPVTEPTHLKKRAWCGLKSSKVKQALIVEDDVDLGLQLTRSFQLNGWSAYLVTNVSDAKKCIFSVRPNLLILDWYLDGSHIGLEVVEHYENIRNRFKIRSAFRDPLQIITYSAAPKSRVEFGEQRACRHLDHWQKPMSFNDLCTQVLAVTSSGREAG